MVHGSLKSSIFTIIHQLSIKVKLMSMLYLYLLPKLLKLLMHLSTMELLYAVICRSKQLNIQLKQRVTLSSWYWWIFSFWGHSVLARNLGFTHRPADTISDLKPALQSSQISLRNLFVGAWASTSNQALYLDLVGKQSGLPRINTADMSFCSTFLIATCLFNYIHL